MENEIQSEKRKIYCEDAVAWFERSPVLDGCSVVASLPDISEFPGYSLTEWKAWFIKTAGLLLSKTPQEGVTIFYQSDIKSEGVWIDKAYLCQKAAEERGEELLWHKIIARVPPGKTTFKRSSYTHILAFSKGVRLDLEHSTPDVLPSMGAKTWERGMGLEACLMIGNFLVKEVSTETLVHPFCGQGSMLAVANALGLSAIGIERSRRCAEIAQTLGVNLEEKRWSC